MVTIKEQIQAVALQKYCSPYGKPNPETYAFIAGAEWIQSELTSGPVDDYDLERLYDWVMDEKRKPSITAFTAGKARNIAYEFEFRLRQKTSAPAPHPDAERLAEVLKAFQWTFDNMNTPHTPDHFNIPTNGITALQEIIAGSRTGQQGGWIPATEFEIDFGFDLKCKAVIKNNAIEVIAAMDGWGNDIPLTDIKITPVTPTPPNQ